MDEMPSLTSGRSDATNGNIFTKLSSSISGKSSEKSAAVFLKRLIGAHGCM